MNVALDGLRIGVVGCGRMGRERALASQQLGAQVVVVCDPIGDAAAGLAAELTANQVKECRTGRCLADVDWDQLDAMFVCTPPGVRDAVVTAIEQGVPVFMEKPVGISAAGCKAIQIALTGRPTITAVGYMNRYRESVQRVRDMVAHRRLLGVSCDWLVGTYRVAWWADKDSSGGPLNEQATHLVDLGRFIVGEIESVQCLATPLPDRPDLVGTAAINCRFRSGQPFSLLYGCQAATKMIHFTVYDEQDSLRLEGWDFHLAGEAPLGTPRNAIFQTEVQAFLEAVAVGSNEPILSTFSDALKTQHVVDALQKSVLSGHEERVSHCTITTA